LAGQAADGPEHSPLGRCLEIAVRENETRGLAPQFHDAWLDLLRARLQDFSRGNGPPVKLIFRIFLCRTIVPPAATVPGRIESTPSGAPAAWQS